MDALLEPLVSVMPQSVIFYAFVAFAVMLAVTYFIGKRISARSKEEVERLFVLSRRLYCSEFDIFVTAAGKWNVPEAAVKEDFKKYLFFDDIPFYVRDFIRSEFKK